MQTKFGEHIKISLSDIDHDLDFFWVNESDSKMGKKGEGIERGKENSCQICKLLS